MVDKGAIIQVIGSLMQRPELLSEKDKYTLGQEDFSSDIEKIIFTSIEHIYYNGALIVRPVDIDTFLADNAVAKRVFDSAGGLEYLEDAFELAEPDNFLFYYKRLKKFNALRDLKSLGYDTSGIYDELLISKNAQKKNESFEEMSLGEVFDAVKRPLMALEATYGTGDTSDTVLVGYGLEELIDKLKLSPEFGAPLQGDTFNTIVRGARSGKLYIRSAASGTGKTRLAVGDACYLSYPIRYNPDIEEWVAEGSNQKTLFIATEQEVDEIQTLVLSYLTGINEEKILYGTYTPKERQIIHGALEIVERFKDNLLLIQMPNPSIEKIKAVVRQHVILYDIENVIFDYIFVCPALLNEYRDLHLRNDEILLLLSTALKDLAVEQGLFIMSATQLNAKGESDGKEIKNEGAIRGARSIIDKADVAVIVSRVKQNELEMLSSLIQQKGNIQPNLVTDVYKVRRGRFTQLRIWSHSDLGTCRTQDLFATDTQFQPIPGLQPRIYSMVADEDRNEIIVTLKQLNGKLNG